MVLVQSLYDYNTNTTTSGGDSSNLNDKSQLSFLRGATIDVTQQDSSSGWSYGKIVREQRQTTSSSNNSHLNDCDEFGWFPSSYVVPIQNDSQNSLDYDRNHGSISCTISNYSNVVGVVSDHTDDDNGFYGTPMGGYIEPYDAANEDNPSSRPNDEDDARDAPLPHGVTTVAVPVKRQRRIITIPKNLATNISTITVKAANRVVPRRNTPKNQNSTSKPTVYISPQSF